MYLLLLVGARISHLYPGSVNHEEKSLKKLSKDVFLFNAVVFVDLWEYMELEVYGPYGPDF